MVVLPGFPTSAIFTFHEFVAPVIAAMSGRSVGPAGQVQARLAVRVNSEIGRTEYLLVGLVDAGAGSGDAVARGVSHGPGVGQRDHVQPRRRVHDHRPARGDRAGGRDRHRAAARPRAAAAGSGRHRQPLHRPRLPAGRAGARQACARSFSPWAAWPGWRRPRAASATWPAFTCSIPSTGEYNRPFITPGLELIPGYGRLQGLVFRQGDDRFEGRTPAEAIATAVADPGCVMVNRNPAAAPGRSSTGCSAARRPPGYAVQPRNHNAVAAAVVQGRADWGVTLDTVARAAGSDSSRCSTSSTISWCPPRAPRGRA